FASRCTSLRIVAATISLGAAAAAQSSPSGSDGTELSRNETVRSVLVLAHDEPLITLPRSGAPRRGAAAKGARLPYFGRARGAGCTADWFLVGPTAWICGDRATPSPDPPVPSEAEPEVTDDGLPRRYYFVGSDGAFGYAELRSAEEAKPVSSLEPGFSV